MEIQLTSFWDLVKQEQRKDNIPERQAISRAIRFWPDKFNEELIDMLIAHRDQQKQGAAE